jgi:hypothetical protein
MIFISRHTGGEHVLQSGVEKIRRRIQEALANTRDAIREYLDAAAEIDSDAEMRETELSAPRLRDELRTIRERC